MIPSWLRLYSKRGKFDKQRAILKALADPVENDSRQYKNEV
jgi:hypothetical protein